MPSNLAYIANFGSVGTGNTNLSNPRGFDTDGKFLYIADAGNHRIVKWKMQGGAYVAQIGSSGSGDDNFSTPSDVVYWKGRLFIVDLGNDRIKIHRARDLKFLQEFGSTGTGDTNFSSPQSAVTDGEFLYVADTGNDRVVKYDIRSLSFSAKAGSSGTGSGQFDGPIQINYDKDEKMLYIVDGGNTRVLKWRASDLKQFDSIVAADSTDASLIGLSGVAIKDHYVYLTEQNRIQVFDSATLTTRTTAGSSGTGNSNITDGAWIRAYRDCVIFTELGNDRINIWQNYNVRRGFTSGDTAKIIGSHFIAPSFAIGAKQDRQAITIGGTAEKDKFLSIEEEPLSDNFQGVEET